MSIRGESLSSNVTCVRNAPETAGNTRYDRLFASRMSKWNDSGRLAAEHSVTALQCHAELVRAELERIVESTAFRSSRRSREFLRHVIELSLTGTFTDLKERVIGAALYGRPNDYDTASDAIVRVTASDTRRRLAEYYSAAGDKPLVRIQLTAGSYVPNFEIQPDPGEPLLPAAEPAPLKDRFPESPSGAAQVEAPAAVAARRAVSWIWPAVAIVSLSLCVWLWMQNRSLRNEPRQPLAADAGLPWSAMFAKGAGVRLVLPDAAVGAIQVLADQQLAVSEYASGKFIPESLRRRPEMALFAEFLLRSQYTTASYALSAVRMAEVARAFAAPVDVIFARQLSLRSLKGGGNFVFLGTPRSNPWQQLFESESNFAVRYGDGPSTPFFENRKPAPGEQKDYRQRGSSDNSSEAYGSIAFLPGRYPNGHVLMVSGTASEGVEAATELLTDAPRFRRTLQQFGIVSDGSLQRFEILIRVARFTGAPMRVEPVAHRVLTGEAAWRQ